MVIQAISIPVNAYGAITNEEVKKMERLHYIVTSRGKMAGQIFRLQREKSAHTACTGCQKTVEERVGGRRRHGEALSNKSWMRCVSAGMEPAGSPVTETDGNFSSPYVSRGTGGIKSI